MFLHGDVEKSSAGIRDEPGKELQFCTWIFLQEPDGHVGRHPQLLSGFRGETHHEVVVGFDTGKLSKLAICPVYLFHRYAARRHPAGCF